MAVLPFAASKTDMTDFLPSELPERPAGWYGTPITAGKLGGEYEHHTEFASPRRRALTVSRMLRTSAVLALSEELLTSRITAVKFHVQKKEDASEEAQRAADALERWLGLGKYEDSGGHVMEGGSIDDLVRHICSARIYGNVAMSEAWQYDEEHQLYFCTLHRRRQESYDSYITDANGERLVAITQRLSYVQSRYSKIRPLPMNETLFCVWRPDLGWYDGRSILRACYGNWRSEQLRYRQEDNAANSWSNPPLRCVLDMAQFTKFASPGDGAAVTRQDVTNEIASMKTKLASLHSDTSGHIIYADFWKLEEVSSRSGAFDPEPLLRSSEHHQRAMAERLFTSSLVTQGRKGDGGSRSMVDTQSQVVTDATIDAAQWVVNCLNRQTVRRFLTVNFSGLPRDEWPILTFSRGSIVTPWWQRNAQSFATFVGQQILTMSEADEAAIRAASDLPPPPEDAPDVLDRKAMQVGGRLKTPAGQREALTPATSKPKKNSYVNRLVKREDDA